jgi:hypothetical protein
MAFGDVVGELFGFSSNKAWTLSGDDAKFADLEFEGQYVPQNYREGGGDASMGEASTLNAEAPNIQFLGNEGELVTFNARFYATDSFKNIKQQIETLRSFKKRDPDLKRSPKFLFTYGTEIEFTCFVRKVDYAYDELRSDGSIRGVVATIQLQKLDQTLQGTEAAATSLASQIKFAAGIAAGAAGIFSQVKSRINIPGGSLHTLDRVREVRQGDTFERIAQQEYGNALLGDVLRRAQPDKADLQVGDTVILVEPKEITTIEVTQQSTPLKDNQENSSLREEFFINRNRRTTIFV